MPLQGSDWRLDGVVGNTIASHLSGLLLKHQTPCEKIVVTYQCSLQCRIMTNKYVLVSSALQTAHRDITFSVF